jgi:hypothetical protein
MISMRENFTVQVDGLELRLDPNTPIEGRQSAVKDYLNCHRLYGWQRVENLTPDKPRWPLEFGNATHKFLQERGKGATMEEAMQAGKIRLFRDIPKSITPFDDEEKMDMRELAERLWPGYDAHWRMFSDEAFIPLGQEVKGRVEVGTGTGVFLVFQLDKLVSFLNNLWVVDYKTMGKNDDREFQKFEIDMQPTAYIYGASKVLKQRVAGIIIDGLIKTKTPQYRREQYLRTDAELEEFEREFPEIMHEVAWRHKRVANGEDWKTVFYKNTKHCFTWGRQCDFFLLCQRDSPVMRMQYRQRDQDYMDDPALLTVPDANQGVRSDKV